MSRYICLKKGLDLHIPGAAPVAHPEPVNVSTIAIVPDDFPGFTPKIEANEGDAVAAGAPIFRDKWAEDVKIVAPAAGVVKEVVRGQRRKIERVIVELSQKPDAVEPPVAPKSRQDARRFLKLNGLWTQLRQRPYDIVPEPEAEIRDIFVTAFDGTPLAPDFNLLLNGRDAELAEGVRILSLLTDGNVYVSRRKGKGQALADIPGAQMVDVEGPCPSCFPGVQAANIAPVNKGETVITLDAVTLARIGHVALHGHADAWSTTVAVTGSEIRKPCYIKTVVGAPIQQLIGQNINDDHHNHRIISGNVLTGKRVLLDGFLRAPFTHITVIREGNDVAEFMGWATMLPSKWSISRSFPGHFLAKIFNPDARLMGGRRAMIMSGEYERVMPMDIMPEFLLKAIISRNIDSMEALGIYEVAPEDFAVAEYCDTSKLPLQQIVREGLDFLRKELK